MRAPADSLIARTISKHTGRTSQSIGTQPRKSCTAHQNCREQKPQLPHMTHPSAQQHKDHHQVLGHANTPGRPKSREELKRRLAALRHALSFKTKLKDIKRHKMIWYDASQRGACARGMCTRTYVTRVASAGSRSDSGPIPYPKYPVRRFECRVVLSAGSAISSLLFVSLGSRVCQLPRTVYRVF